MVFINAFFFIIISEWNSGELLISPKNDVDILPQWPSTDDINPPTHSKVSAHVCHDNRK